MSEKPSTSTEIVVHRAHAPAKRRNKDDGVGAPPAIIAAAGGGAEFAWDEFFKASLPNAYTRKNYIHAVRKFLAWCDHDDRKIPLTRIAPGDVGEYLQGLELSPATKKLHLAAIRKFFDRLVVRHVVILNPAASARSERYQVIEGKTEEIKPKHARQLLDSIDTGTIVGLRDRAILAVLVYTATRVGAVAKLTLKNLKQG
ncbi:MAG: phage integrase N-terminal SAM-like domain-containing protein [Isosphaeraceae bacterium]